MSITTIIGPMFSGKTTEFIRLIERKKIAGKKCLIIKNYRDIRYDSDDNDKYHITTHNNIIYRNCDIMFTDNLNKISLIETFQEKYDVIGIEEGFFFEGVTDFSNELANRGMEVIISTLESSYKQEIFSEIGKLIAISEDVIKLKAICMECKTSDASFTIRTIESDEKILVGGIDKYQSVCRKCLNIHKRKNTLSRESEQINNQTELPELIRQKEPLKIKKRRIDS